MGSCQTCRCRCHCCLLSSLSRQALLLPCNYISLHPQPPLPTAVCRYFFGMLERMQADVGTQPDSPQKAALVQRLASIHQDATAAEAAGGL